jgi:hypothetical protein
MLSILRILLNLSFLILISCSLKANEIKVNNFSLILVDESTYNLKINYLFSLNEKLNDLISIGIPIYFESELIVTYPAKYTFGLYRKKIYENQKQYRLIYSPITNTYKVSLGMLSQTFSSLPMAINVIKKITYNKIIAPENIESKKLKFKTYFRLATNRLPKPFQLNFLTDQDQYFNEFEYFWQIAK